MRGSSFQNAWVRWGGAVLFGLLGLAWTLTPHDVGASTGALPQPAPSVSAYPVAAPSVKPSPAVSCVLAKGAKEEMKGVAGRATPFSAELRLSSGSDADFLKKFELLSQEETLFCLEGSPPQYFVRFSGRALDPTVKILQREGFRLLSKGKAGEPFKSSVRLGGEWTEYPLVAVDEKGRILQGTLEITQVEGTQIWSANGAEGAGSAFSGGRFQGNVAVGYAYHLYAETLSPQLTQQALVAKFGAQFALGARWALAANVYGTLFPFASNLGNTDIRFLGTNGRVGWKVPGASKRWEAWLWLGWYYTTTWAPSNSLGFKDMNGPQLYPTLSFSFGQGRHSLSAYGKYSPVSEDFVPTFRSHELAAGLSYLAPASRKGRRLGVSIDFARLYLNLRDLVFIDSRSTSLSFVYHFPVWR
jgi:hypothetical protein